MKGGEEDDDEDDDAIVIPFNLLRKKRKARQKIRRELLPDDGSPTDHSKKLTQFGSSENSFRR